MARKSPNFENFLTLWYVLASLGQLSSNPLEVVQKCKRRLRLITLSSMTQIIVFVDLGKNYSRI